MQIADITNLMETKPMPLVSHRSLWYTLGHADASRLPGPVDVERRHDEMPPGALEWEPGLALVFAFRVLIDEGGDRYLSRINMAPLMLDGCEKESIDVQSMRFENFVPKLSEDLGLTSPEQIEALRLFMEDPYIYPDTTTMMLGELEMGAAANLGEPSVLLGLYNAGLQKEEVFDLRTLETIPAHTPLQAPGAGHREPGFYAMERFIRENKVSVTSSRSSRSKDRKRMQWVVDLTVGRTGKSTRVTMITPTLKDGVSPPVELVMMDLGFELSMLQGVQGDYEYWAESRRSLGDDDTQPPHSRAAWRRINTDVMRFIEALVGDKKGGRAAIDLIRDGANPEDVGWPDVLFEFITAWQMSVVSSRGG